MKTIIFYESRHHGNTKKLCDKISNECGVTLCDTSKEVNEIHWEDYDLVGFASGIEFNKYYESVNQMAALVPSGKKVFFLYTCANNSKDFAEDIRNIVEKNGAEHVGTYGCKGFNTYGPLKLIGGMNKNNPTKEELDSAIEFYKNLEMMLQ